MDTYSYVLATNGAYTLAYPFVVASCHFVVYFFFLMTPMFGPAHAHLD